MPGVASKRGSRSPAPSSYAHPHLTERQQLALALKQSAGSSSVPSATKCSPSGFIRVWMVVFVYVVAGTTLPITIHSRLHGFNLLQAALAFFLVLNVLICFWEISLGMHIIHIRETFKSLQATYGNDRMRCISDLFFSSVSFKQIFSTKFWSQIWASYSLYDPSYSNQEAYGFFIDVGNGWSTLAPSLLLLVAMTTDSVYGFALPGAFAVGVVGIISFYQEFYGTVLYYLSFFYNGRQRGIPMAEVIGWVGGSNGIWIVFPLIGMYASFQLIQTGTFNVFRNQGPVL